MYTDRGLTPQSSLRLASSPVRGALKGYLVRNIFLRETIIKLDLCVPTGTFSTRNGGIPLQIYADNAATTKPCKAAIQAMVSCMEQNYGNPSSVHHIGQAAAEALLQARQDIACLLYTSL